MWPWLVELSPRKVYELAAPDGGNGRRGGDVYGGKPVENLNTFDWFSINSIFSAGKLVAWSVGVTVLGGPQGISVPP